MQQPFSSEFAWPSPAKLNLFLHVTGRRPNGYHELQTVFQFLDLRDDLYFVPRGDGISQRLADVPGVPEEDDLSLKASRLLSQSSGCGLGADIRLVKRIPVGGGLGGGSSNAATTLVALNRLWNLGLTIDELCSIGVRLGADVPVFLNAMSAWAEGIGERMWAIALPEPWYVVVTPPISVSTAEIFGAPELIRDHAVITRADFLAGKAGNDCEAVTVSRYPVIGDLLRKMRQYGAARMTGTGSSCFLAMPTKADAEALSEQLNSFGQTFVCQGLNRSPLADIMRGL